MLCRGQDEGIGVRSIGFIATIHINTDDFADVGVIAHAGEARRKAMLRTAPAGCSGLLRKGEDFGRVIK